jgi:hypothetical protein
MKMMYTEVKISGPMAESRKMAVFWNVATYSLVAVYKSFRGGYCLHHQGDGFSP